MQLLRFTIIKLCICLIIGIIISQVVSFTLIEVICLTLVPLLLLYISLVISKKQFIKTTWFGVLAYLTTISIGLLITVLQDEKKHKSHFTHLNALQLKTPALLQFRIRQGLKSNLYYDKYIVDIIAINQTKVSGKSLLHIKKDSLNKPLNIDNIFLTNTIFNTLKPPLNPGQFDYKHYLEKQHIYGQLVLKRNELLQLKHQRKSVRGQANRIRKYIHKSLMKYHFKTEELAIINALILGQRQDISREIYTHYTNAGAIHILAVSGLHIGILLLILNTLLKPIELFKHGKLIKMISLIILLWLYAILAGVSASIVRATTMFTIVAIGMHLQRPSNIYNTLAVSIFLILIFKPLFLFDVGFQLSYAAVFSIITIQPLLYTIIKPKFWIIDKLWQILTVTLAAQLGILPISLFYFHQFSGLFWLSNLVVIPFLGIILLGGLITITLAILQILPQGVATSFGLVIHFMNSFFEWVSSHDQFLIKDISFNVYHLIIAYISLIILVQYCIYKSYKTLIYFFISVISFQLICLYNLYHYRHDAFIVFHKNRQTIIGYKHYKSLNVYHNLATTIKDGTVSNFAVAHQVSEIKEDSLQYLYTFRGKHILLIDSLGIYALKSIKPDYVLLHNSPKINLERLIDFINPSVIIADGSNYKSYIERWKKTCKKRKLPFHETYKKGAFILK